MSKLYYEPALDGTDQLWASYEFSAIECCAVLLGLVELTVP